MNKFSKTLLAFLAIFAVQSCTDLEENLVGDITEEISIPVSDQVDPGNADFFDPGAAPVGVLAGAFSELRNSGSANHGSSSYTSIRIRLRMDLLKMHGMVLIQRLILLMNY